MKMAKKEILVNGERLEDALATDELFLSYFNEFLTLPTFPTALFFNRDTGWFEIVDDSKRKLTKTIKAAVRASQKPNRVYRAVKNHSFLNLPLIPLEEDLNDIIEEINTSYPVVTLNKEQGLRWIKEKRFPAFLQSELYVEYRLAKILSQTQDERLQKNENVTLTLDYTPHIPKIRPEDIVEQEVDDTPILMKNMCVCMGNALPTDTAAFISTARMLESTLTTTSATSDSRPISSLLRPDSGIGSPGKLTDSDDEFNSEISSSRLFSPQPRLRSNIPRPRDEVCRTADSNNNIPSWRQPVRGGVYIKPQSSQVQIEIPESQAEPVIENKDICFSCVDTLSGILSGTVIKYLLAEFNDSQPEVYAHHKAVRDLIPNEKQRDFSLDDCNQFCCEWVINVEKQDRPIKTPSPPPKPKSTGPSIISPHKTSREESDHDSVLGSDDDYEPSDTYFRKRKTKRFYPLTTKRGIEDFKSFLTGTNGEMNWYLWCDIDRTRLLDNPTSEEIHSYLEGIRDTYHKKGSQYELPIGTKRSLGLVESSCWTLNKLLELQNEIAKPLILYWAPKFVLKTQSSVKADNVNKDYKNQRKVRLESAKRRAETHPEPRTCSTLLPLRPRSCKTTVKTRSAQIEQIYNVSTPKDFLWVPPESVALPQTSAPIGRRRTHAVKSVELSISHAGGRKQRQDFENLLIKSTSPRPTSRNSTDKTMGSSIQTNTCKSTISSDERIEDDSHSTGKGSVVSQANSDLSVFEGGRRMTALLAALNNENKSGLFFRRYIESQNNKVWFACVKFWAELQEYHKLFYAEILNNYQAMKKARQIHSQHISLASRYFIGVNPQIRQKIESKLSPPYEELFDEAEVYTLEVLLHAWQGMNSVDYELLNQIQTKTIIRNLETRSKIIINLERRGFLRPGDLEPDDDPMENFEDPVYDPQILEEIPEDFRDFALEKIVRTPIHLENFRQFLQSHFATMDLSCWMDIESFRRLDPNDIAEADRLAKEIKHKYFNKKYFFGPNSPGTRAGLDAIMKAIGGWGKIFPDRPANELIIGAHDFVKDRLEMKWLPMFLASDQFADLIRPPQQMVDAAEALLLNRQRRSQRLMKMLESKWVSSSNEIISFRRSLLNPVISYQFQRFVSVKSDLLENDVLFWRECQKYKHLHHQHSEESFLNQKINVIINCFIDTLMNTPLQIDIPQEQADRILEKKRELGPYIFREAQLTVFRVLFEHWSDFCTFKSNTATDQILPTIERKRRRAKLKERKRLKEMEEQQEKLKPKPSKPKQGENARRRALGLPIEGEEQDEVDPFSQPTKPQKEKEGSEDKSEKGDADNTHVSWSYSHYINALDKEEIINKTNEDTFSCLSAESTTDTKKSVSIDVSDLKDLKAPQPEPTENENLPVKQERRKSTRKSADVKTLTETKGSKTEKKPQSALASKGTDPSKSSKPQKSVTMKLESTNPPAANRPERKMARSMPPLVDKP